MTVDTSIHFFSEDITYKLPRQAKLKTWLFGVAESEGQKIENINYIFCSDDYLLGLNKQYLNHDYYTDIITFQNSEQEEDINADIFISIDRVKDNATKHKTSLTNELHRVLVHGLLHVLGYKDSNDLEKSAMRKKEDSCLSLRDF